MNWKDLKDIIETANYCLGISEKINWWTCIEIPSDDNKKYRCYFAENSSHRSFRFKNGIDIAMFNPPQLSDITINNIDDDIEMITKEARRFFDEQLEIFNKINKKEKEARKLEKIKALEFQILSLKWKKND